MKKKQKSLIGEKIYFLNNNKELDLFYGIVEEIDGDFAIVNCWNQNKQRKHEKFKNFRVEIKRVKLRK